MTNVWIIRPGALGDTLLTLPLLFSIKNADEKANVTLLGSRAYHEIIPPEFNFKSVDHRDYSWLFQPDSFGEHPKEKPCDIAYVILKRPDAVVANLKSCGVDDIHIATPIPEPGVHLVQTLCSQLGAAIPPRHPVLNGNQLGKRENILWAHPGSGSAKKNVPLSVFRSLSKRLRETTGCEIVVTLGEADEELKREKEWELWIAESRPVVLENRSLKQICDLMSHSGFFMGNDSGMSHLAAALGIFSIIFYVSTDPAQWGPWVPARQTLIFDCSRVFSWSLVQNQIERAVQTTLERQ
ncbi:MAG: glycosyltransferase family 9 protein [Desulfomonilaceae bacterium]|jgi:ADP-heptose:LPS heptosyltransferase